MRIVNLGIDIKDVSFFYEQRADGSDKSHFMILPRRKGIDPITNKEIFFLIFSLTDRKKQKVLADDITNTILNYVKEVFASTPLKQKSPFRAKKLDDNAAVGRPEQQKSLWNNTALPTRFSTPKKASFTSSKSFR